MTLKSTRPRRLSCRLHFLRRADERGLPISPFAAFKLERRIAMTAPAFQQPGKDRYCLTIHLGNKRALVVYDLHLRCLVTLIHVETFYIGPMRLTKSVADV